MNNSETPSRRQLFLLLDRIIGEERSFKRHTRDAATLDQLPGETTSTKKDASLSDELEHFRLAQEEMFRVHRKFIDEHELIIQRCLAISRQTRAGLLNDNEMALEVERLQAELARIKNEHGLVEKECQEIFKRRSRRSENSGRRS